MLPDPQPVSTNGKFCFPYEDLTIAFLRYCFFNDHNFLVCHTPSWQSFVTLALSVGANVLKYNSDLVC